jgi:hypothetical protein
VLKVDEHHPLAAASALRFDLYGYAVCQHLVKSIVVAQLFEAIDSELFDLIFGDTHLLKPLAMISSIFLRSDNSTQSFDA